MYSTVGQLLYKRGLVATSGDGMSFVEKCVVVVSFDLRRNK